MAWKSKIWYCIHRRRFIGGLIMHMKVLILEEVIATITFMRDKAEEELIEETEKMFKEMGSN